MNRWFLLAVVCLGFSQVLEARLERDVYVRYQTKKGASQWVKREVEFVFSSELLTLSSPKIKSSSAYALLRFSEDSVAIIQLKPPARLALSKVPSDFALVDFLCFFIPARDYTVSGEQTNGVADRRWEFKAPWPSDIDQRQLRLLERKFIKLDKRFEAAEFKMMLGDMAGAMRHMNFGKRNLQRLRKRAKADQIDSIR